MLNIENLFDRWPLGPEGTALPRHLQGAVDELLRVFRAHENKYDAHRAATPLLEEFSRDQWLFTNILENHLARPAIYEKLHYPVIALPIVLNPYFELVVNCWIPLPDRRTDLSTKAIHHHGKLLLSTATIFGPGYEHWAFSPPTPTDSSQEHWRMNLLERAPHPLHHVAFVDAHVAHVPMYPKDFTMTLALWSSSAPTTVKDFVKRVPWINRNAGKLRSVGDRFGLRKTLDLNVVEYFDFYPDEQGFVGMKDRQEFALGPNENYLYSLFYVIQQSHNEKLSPMIRRHIAEIASDSKRIAEKLLRDLEQGTPIEGRLSEGHFNVAHANFTNTQIEHALAKCSNANSH